MTHRRISAAAFGILLTLAAPRPAHAIQQLEGEEARARIGDAKARFTAGGYAYEILKRSHRDAMNARASDAVIFTNKTNRFYYSQREDSNHIIILGDPKGREEDPATADAAVWNPISNALSDDNPDAHVFLDDKGEELAVVYIGGHTTLEALPNASGLLEIRIKVRSNNRSQSVMGRYR